ncbi:retrovirus-related pol polyprotein from transposon TNT 1-94 [Tanacetum coccineum]|uniref:Retrovirus-related pol polyprotein from transposon TNT 1-94 n=1 Tax=Tanacetum coccineum TaxID=301880 RepID=A0ABQ5E9M8_9ASTR
MSGTVPPISPPLGADTGGSHVTNVPEFDKEEFSSWKDRFLVYLDGIEPYLLEIIEYGPFIPLSSLSTSTNLLPKPQKQWSHAEIRLSNQYHEGPSDTRDTKIAALILKFNVFKALEGEKVNGTFTRLKCLLNDPENNGVSISQAEDSDSDIEEDTRISSEFLYDVYVEFHDRALLANHNRFYKRSGRDKESVSSEDERVTKVKAFMAIIEDEPAIGKGDARSGQWVEITMKKVHRLLSIIDDDERKHVLDYTHVDLHYVEDQRKNLLSKFNSLNPEVSSCKSELTNLKNIKALNSSLQNEITRLNLENESQRYEISDLKKVIKKWTSSRVMLDQLLTEQVPGNIVRTLGGRGKKKDTISSKKVLFSKAVESSSEIAPEITSDFESECDIQEPLPPLPKLLGAEPNDSSKNEISLADLTLMPTKKAQPATSTVPGLSFVKKADSSTKKLLLTLMEEVKGLKEQIKIPLDTSPSVSQSGSSKSAKGKQKTWFGPCKHCKFRNHLSKDCYMKPKCSTCGSTNHTTKEHPEQAVVKKTIAKLKAQTSQGSSSRKALMIPKPFIDCKYYGFKDHHSDECEHHPRCDICSSIAHETADCTKKPSSNNRKPRIANKQSAEPTEKYSKKSGPKVVFGDNSSDGIEGYGSMNCNRITFTRVAYGTIFNQNNEVMLIAPRRRDVYVIDMSSYNEKRNAFFFAKASNSINWLWHTRLSYLNFKNINKLARQNLVAGLPSLTFSKDKTCSSCEKGKHHRASFKTKRSFSIIKCLHLLYMDLFKPVKPQTISHNKYTLVIVDEYSRKMENLNEVRVKKLRSDNGTKFRNHKLEEFCDEKGISQNFSSPCTPEQNGGEAINTACYTQNRSIIVKRHRKTAYYVFRGRSPDISHFYVFGCLMHIHNHRDQLGKFDAKADDGFFLGYSPVAKSFRVFNIRRQEMEETYHVTFNEDDEAISNLATGGMKSTSNEQKIIPLMMNSFILKDTFCMTYLIPGLIELDESDSVKNLGIVEVRSLSIIDPISLLNQTYHSFLSPSSEVSVPKYPFGIHPCSCKRILQALILKAYYLDSDSLDLQPDRKSNLSGVVNTLGGKYCISAALTKQPSAYYSNYLREFWYTAEADSTMNTITFTLSNFDKPLSFDLDVFSTVTDLKRSENYVSLPSNETVRAGLATLGLIDKNDTSLSSSDLFNSSLLKMRYFSLKWRVLIQYIVKSLGGMQGSHDQLNVNQQIIAYCLCWGLDIDIAYTLFSDMIV